MGAPVRIEEWLRRVRGAPGAYAGASAYVLKDGQAPIQVPVQRGPPPQPACENGAPAIADDGT